MALLDEWSAMFQRFTTTERKVGREPSGQVVQSEPDPLLTLLRQFLFTQGNIYGRPAPGGSDSLAVNSSNAIVRKIAGGVAYYIAPLVDCFISVNSPNNETRDRQYLPAGSQNVFVFGPEGWSGELRLLAALLNGDVYMTRMELPWKG